jgi:hypothetical protein
MRWQPRRFASTEASLLALYRLLAIGREMLVRRFFLDCFHEGVIAIIETRLGLPSMSNSMTPASVRLAGFAAR